MEKFLSLIEQAKHNPYLFNRVNQEWIKVVDFYLSGMYSREEYEICCKANREFQASLN